MKFKKDFIKKIIAEEIANAAAMTDKLKKGSSDTKLEHLRRELITLFIEYREKVTKMSVTSKEEVRESLENDLLHIKEKYGLSKLDYPKFFVFSVHILTGKADPQLVTFIKTIARGDRRFGPYLDKLDSYDHSITPEEEKYQPAIKKDPDPGFMRVPKTDNAIDDQEDLRRDRKTLTQSENKTFRKKQK
jgi:hypothetical protein